MNADIAHIEVVKKLYSAFMKKDIPAILGLLSENVEWGEPYNPYNLAGKTRKGHAGFMEWKNIGKDAEDILVLESKKFLTNDDSLAVTGYMKCFAKPTGKVYESDFVLQVKIKDHKICKFQEFFDTYIANDAFRK